MFWYLVFKLSTGNTIEVDIIAAKNNAIGTLTHTSPNVLKQCSLIFSYEESIVKFVKNDFKIFYLTPANIL